MIAIHHRANGFSERWISYCDEHLIPYRLVDCYRSDIIRQLDGCQGLMWHWAHHDHKAALIARQLTLALEGAGLKVFPDSASSWHYDDKLGQKYLFEAAGLPLVPTHTFLDLREALAWARSTTYPKVFKLRAGAGSANVRLVPNQSAAEKLIRRSFGRGWKPLPASYFVKERLWQIRRDRNLKSVIDLGRGLLRAIRPSMHQRVGRIERQYAYFQDFIPDNDHDVRVIVIGRHLLALKRMVREGDFRASGSGCFSDNPDEISAECLAIARAAARTLGTQCVALDFVFKNGRPLIVEASYAFTANAYGKNGSWDDTLTWRPGAVRAEDLIISSFLESLQGPAGSGGEADKTLAGAT